MNKIAAILMIALFLFNLFGYRLMVNYMQEKSDIQFQASINNNQYNEAELLTLVVPLSLPYQVDQPAFEQVNGEITVEGKVYKYVKRKVTDGNLVLLCLPDHNKMKLEKAKTDFFRYSNDLVQNGHSKKSPDQRSTVSKNLAFEYELNTQYCSLLCNSIVIKSKAISKNLLHFPTSPRLLPEQPPELL